MNRLWPRFLRSAYRKEPVTSFILTVGAVDAVIGGVGDRPSLLAVGLGAVGIAILLRVWMLSQRRAVEPVVENRPPIRYLPSQSSSSALPSLDVPRKRSPRSR